MASAAADPTSKRDYYDVLGVSKESSDPEIKKAYRALAFKYHPDRAGDDPASEERFKEAAEAYEVLSDANKRATYDRHGHAGLNGSGFSGFQGVGVEDILSHFSDLFGDAFGFGGGGGGGRRRQARNRATRGADMQYELEIDLRSALKGGEQKLELTHPTPCGTCEGSGAKPGSNPDTCATCQGAGQVRHSQGFLVVQSTCPACRGEGSVISDPCADCTGQGQVMDTREVVIDVPAGVDSGMRLRVPGQGQPGRLGGPAGDLYVFMDVPPDPVFRRDEEDLHCDVEIPFYVAALGGDVAVPTIEDHEVVPIKPGTQAGERLRLRGRGAASLRGGRPGDQYCHVHVSIPKKLSKSQRELLEQFATESGYDPDKGKEPGFFERLERFFTDD